VDEVRILIGWIDTIAGLAAEEEDLLRLPEIKPWFLGRPAIILAITLFTLALIKTFPIGSKGTRKGQTH
jgi:hypothetical protein